MRNKKALEMATGTIIAIVLGLIILVILIIFTQQQVTKSGERIEKFGEEAELAPNKCTSLVLGRYCIERGKCQVDGTDKAIRAPPGEWIDCGKAKGLEQKPDCCPRF